MAKKDNVTPHSVLQVEAGATRMPATVSLLYGPSDQKVRFVIGAGSVAQQVDAVTNDEGDVTVEFVPNTPGPLTIELFEVNAPELIASTQVEIAP
jgi:hypothetical protein